MSNMDDREIAIVHEKAFANNGWFIPQHIDFAIKAISERLTKKNLEHWLAKYELPDINPTPKTIGIIMAGNIPLVGFHDFLSILISGNNVMAKLSSQDSFLPRHIAEKLIHIDPRFSQHIRFEEKLKNMDAVIATGSDNTSRYFEYYFGKYPHIIRKNRTACAILNGTETQEDFANLGKDIFAYFGLGCRNVSKIYVPKGYEFAELIRGISTNDYVMDNHKYANNYYYNKSIFLVNQEPHLDAGFCLLQQNAGLVSPTSVVFYEFFGNTDELENILASQKEKIQCLVSKHGWFEGSFPFGKAQEPELWDYADNIDTIRFLTSLNNP